MSTPESAPTIADPLPPEPMNETAEAVAGAPDGINNNNNNAIYGSGIAHAARAAATAAITAATVAARATVNSLGLSENSPDSAGSYGLVIFLFLVGKTCLA